MLPKDFRGYLDYLDKQGKLLRVKKEIDPKFEIAAGIRKTADSNGPALLFENIKGYPGWRVAGGIFATKELTALALETEPDDRKMIQRYLDCDQKRVKPKLVSTGPVKEVIIKGEDVDLYKLPNPTYSEKDAGPYIIPCPDICRDPVSGIQNLSIPRRMVLGKNKTGVECPPPKHQGIIFERGEEVGKPVGVACVLGAPIEMQLASQYVARIGVDETELAGALRGEPIEMVKCETIDVDVPANAEVVIEGEVIPGERMLDGPFGEYRGDYRSWVDVAYAECFTVRITAITMRKNPIFQAMATGYPMTEDHCLRKWVMAADTYRVLQNMVSVYDEDIKGINYTDAGATCICVISIKKRFEKLPRDIIYTVLTHHESPWMVTVVDDDVDVYDKWAVERAIATRVTPETDIVVLSTHGVLPMYRKKWGIDATVPLKEKEWGVKATPPGVDKVDYV